MKFSKQWLYELLGNTIPTETLLDKLTIAGLEVEACEPVAGQFTNVVVGQILQSEPHPDANKLSVNQVNVGDQTLQIVCGAKNARADLKVAVAIPGAVLGSDFKIKETKLRGILSQGMCCSASELGLAETSEGIIELADDAPIGRSVVDYFQLDDQAITLGITPNRGDCVSMYGVARDTAAIFNTTFEAPPITEVSPQIDDTFEVTVENQAGCPHYVGRVIRDVDLTQSSPLWLQERLRRAGLRSIDPVVDVTNYVMLELGQPMHAFDLDVLDSKIIVRDAKPQEKITLLNGNTAELDPRFLVIADASKILAVAGVMGGEQSGVSTKTKHIFLESAFFAPEQIANRARWLGIHTDSAYRYERGVDPMLQRIAIERATTLLMSLVGGNPGPVIETPTSYVIDKRTVVLPKTKVTKVLGQEISPERILECLAALGIVLEDEKMASWQFSIPSFRFDITIAEDLIEEIVRINGYENVPTTLPSAGFKVTPQSEQQITLDATRQSLINLGYQEIITYSFVDSCVQSKLEPTHKAIALQNPISSEMDVMRTSLLTGLVTSALYNQRRQQTAGKLFEIGTVFRAGDDGERAENTYIAGCLWGQADPVQWGVSSRNVDFFDVKGDLESLLNTAHVAHDFKIEADSHPSLHPGQTASLIRGGKIIGMMGALHPKLVNELDLTGAIYYFEIDFNAFMACDLPKFLPLSKYPSIRRDLALLVNNSVSADEIISVVKKSAGSNATDVTLFDVYRDEQMQDNKSVALSITLQDFEKTLTDEEVKAIIDNVVQSLNQEVNATLRE